MANEAIVCSTCVSKRIKTNDDNFPKNFYSFRYMIVDTIHTGTLNTRM